MSETFHCLSMGIYISVQADTTSFHEECTYVSVSRQYKHYLIAEQQQPTYAHVTVNGENKCNSLQLSTTIKIQTP